MVGLGSAIAPAAAIALSGFRFDLSLTVAFVTGAVAVLGWFRKLWITGHPLLAIKFAPRCNRWALR